MAPKASIIIVNYNTYQLTCNCIESVAKYTSLPHEIILVDNASTECNPDLFKEKFPFIKLVKNPLNNGFAAGNNLGIKYATGDLILLLNSDTYLTEDAISKTATYLLSQNKTGVVGCKMLYPDSTLQYTARRFRSIQWELLDWFRPVLYVLSYQSRAKLMLGKYFNGDFNTESDWLNGAFFMFHKDILAHLPQQKLDERFFMYGEDHLWCWQIQQAGFVNYFYSETSIVHISSGSTSIEKQLNLRKLMLKHELEIVKERKGKGLYYACFSLLYQTKEQIRNAIKWMVFKLTGKLIR